MGRLTSAEIKKRETGSITDPNDPRLLDQMRANDAKNKVRVPASGSTPNPSAQNAPVPTANVADVNFVNPWNAVKKVWNIYSANSNLESAKTALHNNSEFYKKVKAEWLSNPTSETHAAWISAQRDLNIASSHMAQAKKDVTAAHAGKAPAKPETVLGAGSPQEDTNTNTTKVDAANKAAAAGSAEPVAHGGGGSTAVGFTGSAATVSKTNAQTTGGAKTTGNTKSSGGAVYGSGVGSNAPVGTSASKTTADWEQEYGVQAALVNSIPTINALFNKAVANKWTTAQFNAQLLNDPWFKAHGNNFRVAYAMERGDKGVWKQNMALAEGYVRKQALSLGVTLDPNEVTKIAHTGLYSSMGDPNTIQTDFLNKHILSYGNLTGKSGTALTTINALKTYGSSMGIEHDDKWYMTAAKNVILGHNVDDYKQQIANVAKTKYSQYADQIDAGHTVAELASPYINSMSRLLEVDPSTLNINDGTINQALTNVDPATNKQSAVPLWKFETNLRQDPRWASTKNARDTVDATARKILSDFGLVS